jgi:CHAT domain-containing protein
VTAHHPARDRWFDALFLQIISLAKGPHRKILRSYAPVSDRTDLGAAALVALICSLVSDAMTTVQITDRLLASGCLGEQDRAEVTSLVRDVRLQWPRKGLPIADWWDGGQLLGTLLTYLAPRIAAEHGPSEAARHLKQVFDIGAQDIIDSLITYPLNPPPMPDSLSKLKPATDEDRGALDLLADFTGRPGIREYIEDMQSKTLLGGGAPVRPTRWKSGPDGHADTWLFDAQATALEWEVLSAVTRHLADGNQSTVPDAGPAEMIVFESKFLARAASIASDAWDQCVAWQEALSLSEKVIIHEQEEQELRRRRWLDAYLGIYHISPLLPNAIPDIISPGKVPPISDFVNYTVFDLGARITQDYSGPLGLWRIVVETDEEEDGFNLSQRGPRQVGVSSDGNSANLTVVLEQGDTNDPIHADFHFALDDPRGAIRLLIVALAGVRLDVYRLRHHRELRYAGSATIQFPAGSLESLISRVDETFACAEAARPDTSPFAILTHIDDQVPILFAMADNAKSEDMLFDIGLFDGSPDDDDFLAVSSARSALAISELARVSAELDDDDTSIPRARAEKSRNQYHILRQKSPRMLGRQASALVSEIVTSGRSLVQFANVEGYLDSFVVIPKEDGPSIEHVDLSHVTVEKVQEISDLWLSLVSSGSPWHQAADALDTMLQWIGSDIMTPVNEVLQAADVQHVIFCPTRALEPVPLHAAPVGTKAIADAYRVSYAPSAAILSQLAAAPTTKSGLDLVVESTGTYAPSNLRLPVLQGAAQEAQALQEIAPSARIIQDADATPEAVLAAIAGSHVAHLTGHGRSHADELASGLWLTGSTRSSSLLSAARVHAGPLLRDTSLVILSACETARHPLEGQATQAWRGLDSAFLSRGVRSVISSLWEISDLAALIYSIAFHSRLNGGATIADAHSTATAALRTGNVDTGTGALLDLVQPRWRTDMEIFDLHRAYWWSAYRLSGVCWELFLHRHGQVASVNSHPRRRPSESCAPFEALALITQEASPCSYSHRERVRSDDILTELFQEFAE